MARGHNIAAGREQNHATTNLSGLDMELTMLLPSILNRLQTVLQPINTDRVHKHLLSSLRFSAVVVRLARSSQIGKITTIPGTQTKPPNHLLRRGGPWAAKYLFSSGVRACQNDTADLFGNLYAVRGVRMDTKLRALHELLVKLLLVILLFRELNHQLQALHHQILVDDLTEVVLLLSHGRR